MIDSRPEAIRLEYFRYIRPEKHPERAEPRYWSMTSASWYERFGPTTDPVFRRLTRPAFGERIPDHLLKPYLAWAMNEGLRDLPEADPDKISYAWLAGLVTRPEDTPMVRILRVETEGFKKTVTFLDAYAAGGDATRTFVRLEAEFLNYAGSYTITTSVDPMFPPGMEPPK